MSTWYAVHTRSNFEPRVSGELTLKGFESYLPVFQELHRWKDRTKLLDVPVFRSYVFARFEDNSESRLAVLRCQGAARILGARDSITPVPEEEIEAVRRMLSAAAARCLAHPLLRDGAWVRVKRGPLKNLEGLLVRAKNQTRLVVSVTLLSQSVSTEVGVGDVEFVRAGESAGRRVG